MIVILSLVACDDLCLPEETDEYLLQMAQRAAYCQEMYLNNSPGPQAGYAPSVQDLFACDPSLTADPQLVFSLLETGTSGYLLVVFRRGRDAKVVCNAKAGCWLVGRKK